MGECEILDRLAKKGIAEKVTFEYKLEGGEGHQAPGVACQVPWGKVFQAKRTAHAV